MPQRNDCSNGLYSREDWPATIFIVTSWIQDRERFDRSSAFGGRCSSVCERSERTVDLLVRAASLSLRCDRCAVVSPTRLLHLLTLAWLMGCGGKMCRARMPSLVAIVRPGPLPQQVAVGRTDADDDSGHPPVAMAAGSSRRVPGLHLSTIPVLPSEPARCRAFKRSGSTPNNDSRADIWCGRCRSVSRSGAAVAIRVVAAGRVLPESDRALPQDNRHRGRPDRAVRSSGGPDGTGSVRCLLRGGRSRD